MLGWLLPNKNSAVKPIRNAPARKNGKVIEVSLGSRAVLTAPSDLKTLPGRIGVFRDDVVGKDIAANVCPVALDNGTWIVLVTPQFLHNDVVKVTLERCAKQAGTIPAVYQITPTFLLTLREGGGARRTQRQDANSTVHKAAFEEILAWGVRNRASDVHLTLDKAEPTSQIHYTIDGKYVAPARWRIPTTQLESILNVAWQGTSGGASPVFSGESEQQARIEFRVGNTRYMGRWASMAADRGPSVCIRLLNITDSVVSRSLEEQGFLPSQIAMFSRAQMCEGGAIALAGVVGSGKSTTIATLLSTLPRTRKIITLEDPVEYRIANALQNTIARSLEESDEQGFLSKLRTVKRSAPHDLLLGEIRDEVTGRAFMDVTGTGTNVYTTVHAKSALQIPERLASSSIGIPNSFLASPGILNLLVFQALIPVLCSHCSIPLESLRTEGGVDAMGVHQNSDYWAAYIDRFSELYAADPSTLRIRHEGGCSHCQHQDIPELSGYSGRTVVAEMIEPNTDRDVLRHIMSGNTLRLQEHLDKATRSRIDDPDMTNKSIMECAVYKALQGQFDPRDVELRTRAFETEQLIRLHSKRVSTVC